MYIVCLQALMNVGYAHHIRSSTGIGLLHLAEWLCPPLPLQKFPSRYAYACT